MSRNPKKAPFRSLCLRVVGSGVEKRLFEVQAALAARRARRMLFPDHLFADPAWDILLALYAAALQEEECGLDCLAVTGFTTKLLLSWIDALQREGLVTSIATERRPTFRLTISGLSRMESFFSRPIDTSHC